MKILFDFISIQGSINGGREYVKKVLETIHLNTIEHSNVSLYALFDSKIPFIEDDKKKYNSYFVEWFDINKVLSIDECIRQKRIDVLFIGILQRYVNRDLSQVSCKSVVVIHDDGGPEIVRNKTYRLRPYTNWYDLFKRFINEILDFAEIRKIQDYSEQINCHKSFLLLSNVSIVTVSEFSKRSIQYNHPFLRKKEIKVLYSPLRSEVGIKPQAEIANLVSNGGRYFVALGLNRWQKNIKMVLSVFKEFLKTNPNYYLVTTGAKECLYPHHIGLSYLDDAELNYVIKNAKALIYPTYNEGFGYPPIEAMRFNVPVISSYETSLPEILDSAALFFSPLHESDLWRQLNLFEKMDKEILIGRIKKQYKLISQRQKEDLNILMNLILN